VILKFYLVDLVKIFIKKFEKQGTLWKTILFNNNNNNNNNKAWASWRFL